MMEPQQLAAALSAKRAERKEGYRTDQARSQDFAKGGAQW